MAVLPAGLARADDAQLETEEQKIHVAGALFGEQHHPRIVQIDGYELSVKPERCLIVLRNNDVPGVIGRVGTLLAQHGLNIAEYIQSREAEGGLALAAVAVDSKVSPEFLEKHFRQRVFSKGKSQLCSQALACSTVGSGGLGSCR